MPEPLRQELVNGLMAARRAVGAARRANDPAAERRARDRVHAAKVALGERGPKWWEGHDAAGWRARAEACLVALLRGRGALGVTLAEVADAAGGRGDEACARAVREAVADLAAEGRVRPCTSAGGAEGAAATAPEGRPDGAPEPPARLCPGHAFET